MKKIHDYLLRLALHSSEVLLAAFAISCTRAVIDEGEGVLTIHFVESSYSQTKVTGETVPDTSDFLLKVTDASGKILFDGKYGDSPEKMLVKAGTYTVSAQSREFKKPAFASPVYGDEQCVVVKSGKTADVRLECKQANAGVRLKIASNFLTSYPEGVLFLKSSDGRLMYSYTEKRVAYFQPGSISLALSNAGTDKTLFTKTLKAGQILDMSVSAPGKPSTSEGKIIIDLDTSRTWLRDSYVIGGGSSGGNTGGGSSSGDSYKNAMSVTKAMTEIGAEGVWVYGYIVGGDLTKTGMSTDPPFEASSNFAIAGRASITDKESCLSVQIPSKASARDALNLVTNPENLKRKVFLKGNIVESYFDIPGIKNVTDFVFE